MPTQEITYAAPTGAPQGTAGSNLSRTGAVAGLAASAGVIISWLIAKEPLDPTTHMLPDDVDLAIVSWIAFLMHASTAAFNKIFKPGAVARGIESLALPQLNDMIEARVKAALESQAAKKAAGAASAIMLALFLASCGVNPSAPISTSASATVLGISPGAQLKSSTVADLQAAEWDAFQAMTLTPPILAFNDQPTACLSQFMARHGIDLVAARNAAAKSSLPTQFTPRNKGVASFAMIAYIKEQLVKSSGLVDGKLQVSTTCAAVIINFFSGLIQQAVGVFDPLGIAGNLLPKFEVVPDGAATAVPLTQAEVSAVLTAPAAAVPATVPAAASPGSPASVGATQ